MFMKIIRIIEKFVHLDKWQKLAIGSLVCLLVFSFIYFNNYENSLIFKSSIFYLSVPVAYALIGLLEIISGVPFTDLAKNWDSISGWQRGVLGVIIVFLVLAAFTIGVLTFA